MGFLTDRSLYAISVQFIQDIVLFIDPQYHSACYYCRGNGLGGCSVKTITVLVFSVALGIAIDITIRFLVNYKQELPHQQYDMRKTVIETIHSTGISIIYTSLVLIAGFIIFCFSGFGGTQALGWLTSLTLVTAHLPTWY